MTKCLKRYGAWLNEWGNKVTLQERSIILTSLRNSLFKLYNPPEIYHYKFGLRIIYLYCVFLLFCVAMFALSLRYAEIITQPFYVSALAILIFLSSEIVWCKIELLSLRNSIINYQNLCNELGRYAPLDNQGYGDVIRALSAMQVNRLSILHSWLNYEMRLMKDHSAIDEKGVVKKVLFYT